MCCCGAPNQAVRIISWPWGRCSDSSRRTWKSSGGGRTTVTTPGRGPTFTSAARSRASHDNFSAVAVWLIEPDESGDDEGSPFEEL